MMRVPNGSVARSKPKKEYGRHIFAYCNVTTNQVLYSLTQSLKGDRSLKQLPDAGANNNPPKLRKDLWRPLWSITLPDGNNGLSQGLDAWAKLREYRKLHELCWEPPPELERPTAQEEMDDIQKYLDDRGGSKIETVHDIIKQRKKKVRQRMVMDQKANSIADLATILIAQDERGAKTAENQRTTRDWNREEEVAEMLSLAREARKGGLEKLNAKIDALRNRRQAMKGGNKKEKDSKSSLLKYIRTLEKQKRRMQFSANAVAAAEEGRTWDPNNRMTLAEKQAVTQEHLRSLREQIQQSRDAESDVQPEAVAAEEQTADDLKLEDQIVEGQVEGKHDVASAEPTKRMPSRKSVFKRTDKALSLELEMIRRLHARPQRVAKALNAYTARQTDTSELRSLAQHWEAMFRQILHRYQKPLIHFQKHQADLERREDAMEQDDKTPPEVEIADLDFSLFESLPPNRRASLQERKDATPWLNDLVQLISESRSVEGVEARIKELQSLHSGPQPHFPLERDERGEGSYLKVMSPSRMYATALAKAKVEARAAELAQGLESADVDTAVRGEADEGEAKVETAAVAESAEAEMYEATKQIRRLSSRLRDVDRIADYKAALERLDGGESLTEELVATWSNLKLAEKRTKYKVFIEELERQIEPMRVARQVVSKEDGAERLLKMAEAARERSLAARHATDQEPEMLQLRHTAKVYETVANLRQYEDLILKAPESAFEEPAAKAEQLAEAKKQAEKDKSLQGQESTQVQETTSTTEGQEVPIETPGSEAAQQSQTGSEVTTQPDAAPSVDYSALLPSFPEQPPLDQRVALRKKLIRLHKPSFTTSGITVKWNNILDAEYAEAWPEDVRHEPMGFSRHTAPKADKAPIFDVAEYKNQPGGGYTGKKFAREMERRAVREQVKGVTERVLEAVAAREREPDMKEQARRRELARERGRRRAEASRAARAARTEGSTTEGQGVQSDGRGERSVES